MSQSARTRPSKIRARLRAACRSWTVRVSLAVPVLIAALEALQMGYPELAQVLPGGPVTRVAGSVAISALIAALRLRSVRDD